jgi:pimeloyl-ACP methyl ester carboxylesterase
MRPINPDRILYIHGLDSSSRTQKAAIIRRTFPRMLVPDFTGELQQRMQQLGAVLGEVPDWTLIGSSFGGLMGALYARRQPEQVRLLILLAPALMLPEFAEALGPPIGVPTVLIHGLQDRIVPPAAVLSLAEQVFTDLTVQQVDDDHRLHATAGSLDWKSILEQGLPASRHNIG